MDDTNSATDALAAYRAVHADRRNLLIHVATQPLFVAGLLTSCSAPFGGHLGFGAIGVAAMLVAIACQGRGHRMEQRAPAPFRSGLDFVRRLLVEQLYTFPKFVLSGGLARALRTPDAD
jgi:uncharacterized membrane protein YGL010W